MSDSIKKYEELEKNYVTEYGLPMSQILKEYLEKKYKLQDLSFKCRERNIVYYKKIIAKLSYSSGETLSSIGRTLKTGHDNILHHLKTYDNVYFNHKVAFNELADKYDINVEKFVLEFKSKDNNLTLIDEAKTWLNKLSEEDLRFFIDSRIIPFSKMRGTYEQ